MKVDLENISVTQFLELCQLDKEAMSRAMRACEPDDYVFNFNQLKLKDLAILNNGEDPECFPKSFENAYLYICFIENLRKFLDDYYAKLSKLQIAKSDIDAYAQAGNEKFYGTENCLIFARSYFGLKSFEEAENVDVQEYLLASRDNYSKFYAQKRAGDFQKMKQKSRKP